MTALIAGTLSSKAQTGPGSCTSNTVVGNVGGGLTCLASPTISVLGFAAAAANGINDQSTIAGSTASFWPSNGPAIVDRMNRLAIGEASTANLSPGGNTWVDALSGNFSVLANITSLATIFSGINAAGRTSDTVASGIGTPSGGSAGGYFLGYNDDNTSGNIALGTNSIGVAKTGTMGIVLGAQQDIDCNTTPYVSTPAAFENGSGGTCIGLLVTAGAFAGISTTTPSVAMVVGAGATKKFAKGLIFSFNSLDPSQGNGGAGVALEMYPGHSMRWYNGTTVFAEVGTLAAGGVFGITTNSSQWDINGVATVSCSGVNAGTVVVTNGIITHC